MFVLEGGRPGRTVLLRADIDALPVEEAVELPFRSRVAGVMHACGHDGHAAALVGAAAVLAARAEELPGRYAFVLQPGEEMVDGARRMIAGGLLETVRPDVAISMHLAAPLPAGLVGHRAGIAMAGARVFRISLRGTGGHAALGPAEGNVVLAAAALTGRLGAVVEGMEHDDVASVCAAGLLRAGTRMNVVPTEAEVEGTLRTFTPAQDAEAAARLGALCAAVAADHGVEVELEADRCCPPVVNDAAATAVVGAAVAGRIGAASVFEVPPFTPSDDVGEILRLVPGVHFFVGARPGPRMAPMHHAPDFAIDEESLRVATLAMAAGAVALAGH